MSRATDRIVQGGFLFLIVATPLMFGSVYPWACSLIQLTAVLMWGAWLARLFLLGKGRPDGVPNARLVVPVLLFFALILLQLVPLPASAIKALSPKTAGLYETFLGDVGSSAHEAEAPVPEANLPKSATAREENRSLTLFRKGTRTEALLFLTYLSLFFLLLNYQPDGPVRDFLRRIVAAVVLTGFLVALIGLIQRILGVELIYGLWKPRQQTRQNFMGPYVNANHFAGYLEMTIPLTLGLFLSWAGTQRRRASRKSSDLVATIQSPEYNKIALGVVGVVILLAALFLSISRAGIFSFLVTLFVLFVLLGRQENRYRPERWQALRKPCWGAFALSYLLFGLLALVVFALKLGDSGDFSKTARFQVWSESWRMFGDFPLFGIGLNAFAVISPYFKTSDAPFLFTHVENDYLQLLVETGTTGFLLAGLFFTLFFRETAGIYRWRKESFLAEKRALAASAETAPPKRSSFRSRRRSPRAEDSAYPLPKTNFFLFWGCLGSLISLGVHGLADFNFHIPANALLFFLLLGLLYRLARQNRPLFSFSRARKDFG